MSNLSFKQITLQGDDAAKFLQNQITVDVKRLSSNYLPAAIANIKGRIEYGIWIRKQAEDQFDIVITSDCLPSLQAHIKKFGAFSKFTTYIKQTYGGTAAQANKFWLSYSSRAKNNLNKINHANIAADLTGGDTHKMLKQAKQAFSFNSFSSWLYNTWGYSTQVANHIWRLTGRSGAVNTPTTITGKK